MSDSKLDDALASIYDAGAVRVPPWMSLVTALASARSESIGDAIDWLVAHRPDLERSYANGREAPLAAAKVPAEMELEPELGFLDRPKNDHFLRDRYLFADIVGKQSFYQSAVFAMTGIQISERDAKMLDEFGQTNLLIDRRVWPLAVTRRVAARGGGYAASVLAGTAMLGAPVLAGAAAGDCARFLRRLSAACSEGQTVSAVVAEILAKRERVMGFGRPVVGPDERVPIIKEILRRYERDQMPYVRLLIEADAAMTAQKGLASTAAAWSAAILSDLGMNPDAVQAVSNYWVSVLVFSMALFSHERRLDQQPAATAP